MGENIQFGDEGLQIAGGSLSDHDFEHLLADGFDLGGFGVCGILPLVGAFVSETNDEQSQQVSIRCPDIHVGLNEGLLLADEGSVFVRGHCEAVEVGKAGSSNDIINAKLELGPGLCLVLVQITKGHLYHTALEVVRRNGLT
jgi:hypothetical protein